MPLSTWYTYPKSISDVFKLPKNVEEKRCDGESDTLDKFTHKIFVTNVQTCLEDDIDLKSE